MNAIGNDGGGGGGGGGGAAKPISSPAGSFSTMKSIIKTTPEQELIENNFLGYKPIQIKTDRVLFYIFMLVDMYHDYFKGQFNVSKRGDIIRKVYSFYNTLKILFKGAIQDEFITEETGLDIDEKNLFVIYINKLYDELEKPIYKKYYEKHYSLVSHKFFYHKNSLNQSNLMIYKDEANVLFNVLNETLQNDMELRGRVIPRGKYQTLQIKIELFDDLIMGNGGGGGAQEYQEIMAKLIRVLHRINYLNLRLIQSVLKNSLNIDFKIDRLRGYTANINDLLINDPFNLQKNNYINLKNKFKRNSSGIFLTQFLDAQAHFPISLLYEKFEDPELLNNFLKKFKYFITDINGKLVLACNVELIRQVNGFWIKVNYKLMNYVNSYRAEEARNASARSIVEGRRYHDLFPKFLGDFNQGIESILQVKLYASRDKISFLPLIFVDEFEGIYESGTKKRGFEYDGIGSITENIQLRNFQPIKRTARILFSQGKRPYINNSRGGYYNPYSTSIGWHYETQPAIVQGNPSHHLELHQIGSGKLKIIKKYNKNKSVIKKSKSKKKSKSNVMKKQVKKTTTKKVRKTKTKKQVKKMKGGQDIVTPHNIETGWHYASQPAPPVYSLSDAVEQRNFSLPVQQAGSLKVHIKGVGMRKVRYTKTGKKYVIVKGKRKSLK
jgi:hypothetical protein